MDFKELCTNSKSTPLNPETIVVQFLNHNSDIFWKILKDKDNNIYKNILDILLKKEEKNLKEFIDWYRDYLYNY